MKRITKNEYLKRQKLGLGTKRSKNTFWAMGR